METVLRGAVVYLVLLVVTRLAGRRSLAQSSAFDLVLLLVLSETVQQALLNADASMTAAGLLVLTLVTLDVALAWAKTHWHAVGDLLDGRPTVLVIQGQPQWDALRRARITLPDVMQSARQSHGLGRFAQIEAAVLEVDGTISIIPRAGDADALKTARQDPLDPAPP